MLKIIYGTLCSSVIVSSSLFGFEITGYEIVDLGVLDAEQSRVFDINDQGQVFGIFGDKKSCECFLWDQNNGLQVIQLPYDTFTEELTLNNRGQIAGLCTDNVFIWDPQMGVTKIGMFGVPGEDLYIEKFTDNGQLLIRSGEDDYYFWDNGRTYNISADFKSQIPTWNQDDRILMNNNCDIIINGWQRREFSGYDSNSNLDYNSGSDFDYSSGSGEGSDLDYNTESGSDTSLGSDSESGSEYGSGFDRDEDIKAFVYDSNPAYRAFLWSQGTILPLFQELGEQVEAYVYDINDQRNMIVSLPCCSDPSIQGCYFLNTSSNILAELRDYNTVDSYGSFSSGDYYEWVINNNAPQIQYCTPSKLKVDANGNYYYTAGAEARKLIEPYFPYYFQDDEFDIIKQNAMGYIIGNTDTVYIGQRHGFLAVPVKPSDDLQ